MRLLTSPTISSIGLAVALLVAAPLATDAQDAAKVYRIGVLEVEGAAANAEYLGALRQGLKDLGYLEERNFVLEYRSADGGVERFPDLATELVRLKVDVIVTRGSPAALAAKQATRTIPIVMASSGDPAAEGIVTRLARPEGNVTGFHSLAPPALGAKRLQLLKEAVPGHPLELCRHPVPADRERNREGRPRHGNPTHQYRAPKTVALPAVEGVR
jgi:ABC-type uncharacterized transport system substrate-binding protein